MDIYGQYVADRVIEYGDITTAYGIDRVTGMPVLVFTADRALGEPTGLDAALEHPHLAPTLERGERAGRAYAVQALPMGFSQVKSLRGLALERFLQQGREALEYLRDVGQPHGAVRPSHLWWDGSTLLLSGAGLPWSEHPTFESDLSAFETVVANLGGGSEVLRPRETPRLGFTPRTLEGRASVAVESAPRRRSFVRGRDPEPERLPLPEAPAGRDDGMISSKFLPLEDEDAVKVLSPLEQGPEVVSVERVAALTEPTHSPSLPPVVVQTVPSATAPLEPEPPRSSPEPESTVRIGFGEDDSWRKVREAGRLPSRAAPWLPLLGVVLAAVLIVAGAYALLGPPATSPAVPRPPDQSTEPPAPSGPTETCCVVQFSLEQGGRKLEQQARLLVAEAPLDGPLKAGDVLGLVPGPVRLPAAPARYTILVQLEGFQDQTLELDMPSSQPVVIEFP